MTLNPNQREQATVQGQIDLGYNFNVFSGIVAVAETATLVPGDAVKLSDVAGPMLQFLLCTADNDNIFGYVTRNIKDQSVSAGNYVEIAASGSVVYMTAGAAIARGAKLESDVSAAKVITASSNPVIGIALDKAAADGDLIRVLVLAPGSAFAGSFTTLAASGNTTVGGTLAVTGATTLTGATGMQVATAKQLGSTAAVVVTPGATPAINATLGKVFTVVPAENEAFTTTGGIVGQEIILQVTTSGTSSYNLTFGTGFGANAGTLATGTADAKVFVIKFIHNGTSFVEVSRTAAM